MLLGKVALLVLVSVFSAIYICHGIQCRDVAEGDRG